MIMRKLRLKTKPDEGKVPNDVARWVETYVERRLAEEKKDRSFQLFTILINMVGLAETQYVSAIATYHMIEEDRAIANQNLMRSDWIQAWSSPHREWVVACVEEDAIQDSFAAMMKKLDKLAVRLAPEDLKAYNEYRDKTPERIEAPFSALFERMQREVATEPETERSWVRRLDAADDLDFEL
jgi:hypothetical protein